jgi:hypothetical protein
MKIFYLPVMMASDFPCTCFAFILFNPFFRGLYIEKYPPPDVILGKNIKSGREKGGKVKEKGRKGERKQKKEKRKVKMES